MASFAGVPHARRVRSVDAAYAARRVGWPREIAVGGGMPVGRIGAAAALKADGRVLFCGETVPPLCAPPPTHSPTQTHTHTHTHMHAHARTCTHTH
jgi:hypothetical protein